jgi:curved DNA-binding protein CbpA
MKSVENQAKDVRKLAFQLHKDGEVLSPELAVDMAARLLEVDLPVRVEAHRQRRAEDYEFLTAFNRRMVTA